MKNKLLLCFRPDVKKTDLDNSEFVDDHVFSRNPLSSEHTKISYTKSAPLERGGLKGLARSGTQKRNLIRSFSGGVKPAFFEISLKKKSRTKKALLLNMDSKSKDSGRRAVFSAISNSHINTSESSASSPTSSTSSNQSPTAKEYLTEKISGIKRVFVSLNKKKQTADKAIDCSGSSLGLLCIVILTLWIILFYGRVCAVLFTTLCLHLFSQHRNTEGALPMSTMMDSLDMGVSARNCRKRVIMEGMLERNHVRRTH